MWNVAIIHTFACSACSEGKREELWEKDSSWENRETTYERIEDDILNETEIL